MANPEHLKILKQGVEAWNKWREKNPDITPDLRGADLYEANLSGANLRGANLRGASLERAFLSKIILWIGVDLSKTNLNPITDGQGLSPVTTPGTKSNKIPPNSMVKVILFLMTMPSFYLKYPFSTKISLCCRIASQRQLSTEVRKIKGHRRIVLTLGSPEPDSNTSSRCPYSGAPTFVHLLSG